MLAMLREPEESKCEIGNCKRVGIAERTRVSLNTTILLCQQCAHVWDIATHEQIVSIRKAVERSKL